MAKVNLVGIAKGDKDKKKPTPTKKTVTKVVESHKEKVIELVKSPEEIRDAKAKETVAELLKDVKITQDSEELVEQQEEIELHQEVHEFSEGNEWLEEQMMLLSQENELLRNELSISRNNYSNDDSRNNSINETILQNVLEMYNELQNNLVGNNAQRTPWTTASIPHLLKKMTQLFPFLESYKKY